MEEGIIENRLPAKEYPHSHQVKNDIKRQNDHPDSVCS